ncbi:MAG: ABC transporter ATP-binding protein [Acidobacteria bacterium]|nr:ABC transporter ATP-binding protein [Acidobacteriota bacterium]
MPKVETSHDHGALAVHCQAVSKSYGPIPALANFSLTVPQGTLVSVLGPNGAGKTTAIRLLLGLARPSSGKLSLFGGDPLSRITRIRIGAMLQVGRVPETLRVREHIDLFSSYYPCPLPFAKTVVIAGLGGLETRPFGELSSGQKQRLLFALAICGDPDLLFLDEPTVGLDVEARHLLWNEIRQLLARGKTVLLTTHYLEEADALADRVVVLNHGSIIAEGSPAEIKTRAAAKTIRCVTHLPIALLRTLPGVLKVAEDRSVRLIYCSEAERVLRQLLQLDLEISQIEVASAGLEDAFLALTRASNGPQEGQSSLRQEESDRGNQQH